MDIEKYERFSVIKKNAITAAKELFYGEETVKRLEKATTRDQLSDIMMEARKKKDWRE